MSSRLGALGRLADLAEHQHGQFTLAQAGRCDVDADRVDQLVAARLLEPVAAGVVRLRGGARHPRSQLYAAWLMLNPEVPARRRRGPDCGVVSHLSALALHGLPGVEPRGRPAEFTAPAALVAPHASVTVADLAECDWQVLHGLPVTRPERALMDLALDGVDFGQLGRLADDLVRAGLADEQILADALDRALLVFQRHRQSPTTAAAARPCRGDRYRCLHSRLVPAAD